VNTTYTKPELTGWICFFKKQR